LLFLRVKKGENHMMDELTYETKYLGLGTGDFPKPAYEEEEAYEYEE